MFTVTVDNRVRISPAETLPSHVAKELRDSFVHQNPEYAKKKRMMLPTWNEPPTYTTWEVHRRGSGDGTEHDISFPRGGYARVKAILDGARVRYTVVDARTSGAQHAFRTKIPDHKYTLYDYQHEALEAAIVRQNCLIRAPTGCISGDAIIEVNRAGKSFKIKMRDLVHRQNGGVAGGKVWDPEIVTMVRGRTDDGHVRLIRLLDAYESGKKLTFEVTTSSGNKVRATADHRFLTVDGWKRLEELHVGDRIYVVDPMRKSRAPKNKPNYRQVNNLHAHPFCGRRGVDPAKGGHSVLYHRLVAEARLNNITVNELIRRLRVDAVKGLKFFDPKHWHVHHRDENPANNSEDNLVVLTPDAHRKEHAKDGWMHVVPRTMVSRIVKIEEKGIEDTFDLSLNAPNNFLANGIVVHNSGKTTIAFAIGAKLKIPTLVVVWAGNLFEQWLKRATKELGLAKRDVGVIRGKNRKLKPLTIAMQQTLAKQTDEQWDEIRDLFGAVICDEVQRFAAPTLFDAIDPFPAKYRIGISADESRKDRKEFLIYDLFGAIAKDIPRNKLIKSGHVLDVRVNIVPTRFDSRTRGDFNLLLEEMTDEPTREAQIDEIIMREVAKGEQVMVFTHRREHAMKIDQRLASYGIKSGILLGGKDHEAIFEKTVQGIESGVLRVGIGTIQAMGQGLDIPKLGVGIIATPVGANRQLFGQIRGRMCRIAEGKEAAKLYYMWDRFYYGSKVVKNIASWNNAEMVHVLHGSGDLKAYMPVAKYLQLLRRKAAS